MIRNCYKSIMEYDTKEERNSNIPILFTTMDCQGHSHYFSAVYFADLVDWWNDEDYDGPSYFDLIEEFSEKIREDRYYATTQFTIRWGSVVAPIANLRKGKKRIHNKKEARRKWYSGVI